MDTNNMAEPLANPGDHHTHPLTKQTCPMLNRQEMVITPVTLQAELPPRRLPGPEANMRITQDQKALKLTQNPKPTSVTIMLILFMPPVTVYHQIYPIEVK